MATNDDCGHSHTCCTKVSSVSQSIDEMSFERGIWQTAVDNNYSRTKKLLEKGVSADAADSSGYTALHYASRAGHIEIIKLLFEFKANPNAETRAGRDRPIHRAAYQGQDVVVKLLLRKGADPLAQNADGQTALHKAVQRNEEHVVALLLKEAPALKDIKDKKGKCPFDYRTT